MTYVAYESRRGNTMDFDWSALSLVGYTEGVSGGRGTGRDALAVPELKKVPSRKLKLPGASIEVFGRTLDSVGLLFSWY